MLLDKSYSRIKEILLENMCVSEGSRVLDIGCGRRGNFCAITGDSYYGTDKKQRVIERLRKRETGSFSVMDIKHLDFDDQYFDYVISVSLLHHLSGDELKDAISEVKRVLKDGGRVIFADGVYPESKLNIFGWVIRFFDRGHYVRSRRSLRKLLAGDFHIENEYYFADKIFAYIIFVMSFKK